MPFRCVDRLKLKKSFFFYIPDCLASRAKVCDIIKYTIYGFFCFVFLEREMKTLIEPFYETILKLIIGWAKDHYIFIVLYINKWIVFRCDAFFFFCCPSSTASTSHGPKLFGCVRKIFRKLMDESVCQLFSSKKTLIFWIVKHLFSYLYIINNLWMEMFIA